MTPTLVRPVRRGQALVMSALGMVLLVLMVTMTLSFGTRAKAKMEVQVVADQAAYSTAVAVARSYNVLALTNRVIMAHMTAMLGVQSAISFSSVWYAIVAQMLIYYPLELINQSSVCDPCPFCPMCPYFVAVVAPFLIFRRIIPAFVEFFRVMGAYTGLDLKAAEEAAAMGTAAMALYLGQLELVSNQLFKAVNKQGITKKVVEQSGANMSYASAAGVVAARETGFISAFGTTLPLTGIVGGINEAHLFLTDRHAVMAAMGARGHPFTSNRSQLSILPNSVQSMLDEAANRVGGAANDVNYLNMGNAYFGGGTNLHQNTMLNTNSTFALSDDHGQGILSYSGPRATGALAWPLLIVSLVQSNRAMGFHAGGFGLVISFPFPMVNPIPILVLIPLTPVPHMYHQVNACFLNCPSAWTDFVDYNFVRVGMGDDNNAQPKLPVTVFKDAASAPKDPFNLMFDFRFSGGKKFNLQNGSQGSGGVGSGIWVRDGAGAVDISKQVGYSTGITYYHRGGDHFKEPPNLFNPYWRAGITRADTDRNGWGQGSDIEDTMAATGAPWAAGAFSSLRSNGFKGTP